MADHILVVNAGSSSIKFELFAVDPGDALRSTLAGQLDGIGTHPHLKAKGADGGVLVDATLATSDPDVISEFICPSVAREWGRCRETPYAATLTVYS